LAAVTIDDIVRSRTARSTPAAIDYPSPELGSHLQAVDNFQRVLSIRAGDHVVMLTDPHLDPRISQAVHAMARGRGATFESMMAADTHSETVPEDAKPMIERATLVVSTWFASVFDPYTINLRKEKGQRWVKITFFRDWDALNTPHARFPVELIGELIRGTARLFPKEGPMDLRFTDPRGTDFRVKFTDQMLKKAMSHNRWRGKVTAEEPGSYVHFVPTHGPNLFDTVSGYTSRDQVVGIDGIVFPQWAVGFERPFKDKVGVEFRDDVVHAVHGTSEEAQIFRDFLIGGSLEEIGCGHAPKAARFDIYPAGPNAPGSLHWGVNALQPSDHLRRTLPNWEEPYIHLDMVSWDATVTAGSSTLIKDGFLMSLRDPEVVKAASRFGDPIQLLEASPA
jgi:hypothetical protein